MATDCTASYSVFVVAATVRMYVILTYIVIEYVSMFINAVYTCQMIGPCIFTDYTLDVGYLIF